MSETEQMSVTERRKYLHKIRIRYWQAQNKKERGALLDEREAIIGLHRKSIIRLPSGIGMCEIEFELQCFSDEFVICKLLAMIRS